MEVDTETEQKSEEVVSRRSTRTRLCTIKSYNEVKEKKAKKRKASVSIEQLYLENKITNLKSTALQTIYETPKCIGKGNNTSVSVMGSMKFKRLCNFTEHSCPSKTKLKARKYRTNKMKKAGVVVPTGNRFTVEDVLNKISQISEDENEENGLQLSRVPSTWHSNDNIIVPAHNTTYCANNSLVQTSTNITDISCRFNQQVMHETKNLNNVIDNNLTEENNLAYVKTNKGNKYTLSSNNLLDVCESKTPNASDEESTNIKRSLSEQEHLDCSSQKRYKVKARRQPKKTNGKRRVSGIMKPLYALKSLDCTSSPDSSPNCTISPITSQFVSNIDDMNNGFIMSPDNPLASLSMTACSTTLDNSAQLGIPKRRSTRQSSRSNNSYGFIQATCDNQTFQFNDCSTNIINENINLPEEHITEAIDSKLFKKQKLPDSDFCMVNLTPYSSTSNKLHNSFLNLDNDKNEFKRIVSNMNDMKLKENNKTSVTDVSSHYQNHQTSTVKINDS